MSGGKPQMLMCYLCGREFGTRSLPIHVPQCEKKWLQQEAQKPPAEQRPLPQRPERLNAILKGVSLKEEERAGFNEEMYNNYDQDVLEKCQWCGRTFNPAAMNSHAKSCTQESPAKPAGTGLTKASLSNTITPGKVFGTRHVGSQNAHAEIPDLPGAPGVSPRAQSAKRLTSASTTTLQRSGSKGPKKAPGSVTFTSFEQLQAPPPIALTPGMQVVYKEATPPGMSYPRAAQMVVYSQTGAATVPPPLAPKAMAPILVAPKGAPNGAPMTPRSAATGTATGTAIAAAATASGGKTFNFCSECGTKFQASAKFCHECGVMRPGSEPCRMKYCHFCGARGNVKIAPRR